MIFKSGEIIGNIIERYPNGNVDVDYDGTIMTLPESENELLVKAVDGLYAKDDWDFGKIKEGVRIRTTPTHFGKWDYRYGTALEYIGKSDNDLSSYGNMWKIKWDDSEVSEIKESLIEKVKNVTETRDLKIQNGASLDSKQFYISQRDKAVEELKITKDKSRIKSLDKKIKNYQLRIDYLNEVDWNNTGWGFDEAEDGKKIDSKKTALNWWRHTLSINEQNKFIEKYAPIYTPDYMRAVIYGEHNNTILEIWQKEGSPEWSDWLYETYGVGDLTDKYYTHTRSGGLWKRIHTNNTRAEGGIEIPVMDEEEYLSVNGASRQGFGDSALHKNRGGASDKTWTKIIDAQAQKDRELMALREKLRAEYAEKVAKGEIRPPSRYEKLISTAKGNPDREDVQAARRILEKHGKPNCDWDKENQSCNYGCKIEAKNGVALTSPSTLTMGFEEFLIKLPDITSPFVGEEGVVYKAKYNRYSSRIDYFKHGRKNLTHTTTVGAYLHFIYDVYGVRFRDLSLDEKKALFGKYANR